MRVLFQPNIHISKIISSNIVHEIEKVAEKNACTLIMNSKQSIMHNFPQYWVLCVTAYNQYKIFTFKTFTHRAIADLVIVKKMLHEEKPAKRNECDLYD